MKILYSIHNNINSTYNAKKIIEQLSNKHTIAIAAFSLANKYFKDIHWNLSSAYVMSTIPYNKYILNDLFENVTIPILNENVGKILLNQVAYWNPDLVISDNESILRCVANKLNIPLWGVSGSLAHRAYMFGSYKTYFKVWNQKKWFRDATLSPDKPVSDKYIYYSPFELHNKQLRTKFNLEKVSPTVELNINSASDIHVSVLSKKRLLKLKSLINKLSMDYKISIAHHDLKDDFPFCSSVDTENVSSPFTITCGNSTEIAYSLKKKSSILVIPDLKDLESCFNGSAIKVLNYGDELGQIELMGKYSLDYVEKFLDRKYEVPYLRENQFHLSNLIAKEFDI